MTIRAVVFDIGGVLEITPDLGVTQHWEKRLGLAAGELDQRMHEAWVGGSIGTITLDDVHQALQDRLGLDERQLPAFMADLWREYDHAPFVTAAREAGPHVVRYQDNAQAIADIEELLGSGRYGESGVQL